jgi:hypothetical protein
MEKKLAKLEAERAREEAKMARKAEESKEQLASLREQADAWHKANALSADSLPSLPSLHHEASIVSTEKVICHKNDKTCVAILLIHKDGTITVKCAGDCYNCQYGTIV